MCSSDLAAWQEILPKASLRSTDNRLRAIEYGFRQTLLKHEIGDDTPVDPYFAVEAVFDIDPPDMYGVQVARHRPAEAGGAWSYDPPIKSMADLDKLRLPTYTYNHARTQEELSRADELLGDILPVRLVCPPPWHATLCSPAAELRGLAEMMLDLADQPELVHRLMAYLRDWLLSAMQQVQATGLLTPNNTGPMTCSDPVGTVPADGKVTYRNCWCMANSQEFDQVSPAMWKEFLLNYQKPIFERFGAVCYGCCENLSRKIDGVLSIPNLRIFVCSAWTNLDTVIEKVGKKHVIMWRQKASDVVFPDDVATLRRQLDEGMRKLQGHHVQIVLRELQTLAGHPDRLHVWTKLAIEAAEKYV